MGLTQMLCDPFMIPRGMALSDVWWQKFWFSRMLVNIYLANHVFLYGFVVVVAQNKIELKEENFFSRFSTTYKTQVYILLNQLTSDYVYYSPI